MCCSRIKDGTRARHLEAVEKLHQAVADQFGRDRPDAVIAALDFDGLEAPLAGFLTKLRNERAT